MRNILFATIIMLAGFSTISCEDDSVSPKTADGVFEVDSIFPVFYVESDGGQMGSRLQRNLSI